MTKEEETKRNEAIALLIKSDAINSPHLRIDTFKPNEKWEQLMPAYVHIQKLGYGGKIEKSANEEDYNVGFYDKEELLYGYGNYNTDLQTAIWLTVSDFAIDFNKRKDENNI